MSIGITVIFGPEGSGKTSLMTWYVRQHDDLGGKTITLPGYQAYRDREQTQPICQEMTIEQMVRALEKFEDVLLVIDELDNYFDNAMWWSNFLKLTAGIWGQRGHRNLGVICTVQFLQDVPAKLMRKVHFLIKLSDLYFQHQEDGPTEKGVSCSMALCDVQGFFNGQPGAWYPGQIFHPVSVRPFYNRSRIVDITQKFTKVNIKGATVNIDLEGNILKPEKPKVTIQKADKTVKLKLEYAEKLLNKGATPKEVAGILKGAK